MKLYTDGSCLGNPGRGGWAYISPDIPTVSKSGNEPNTTNNRMELKAIIEALKVEGASVVVTDSQYCKQGIESWSANWVKNGWKTSNGKPVKNKDLWTELLTLTKTTRVTFEWVKGHSKDPWNSAVDALAVEAASTLPR